MTETIDLSIIIISFNTKQLLADCLESVYQQTTDGELKFEVIVIDNNSDDGSSEMVKRQFPKVRLIENSQNIGFGRANNQGIRAAQGNTILLLNSDIVVLERAIEKLYAYLQLLPSTSIIGGKLFNSDMTAQSSCGPAYTLRNIFTALFLKGDHLHITRFSPDTIRYVDWVMGACIMTRKQTYAEVGWFDEDIFMYMEEIDFQHRAKKQGYEVVFYPDARFIHVGHASSEDRTNPILNVFRGFIYFYKKHYNGVPLLILRIILVLKSIAAIVLFTLLGRGKDRRLYQKAFTVAIS